MLRKVLNYLQGFPGVWFTTHSEIVRWYDAQGIDDPSYAKRFFA
jgi:hypothetical protein